MCLAVVGKIVELDGNDAVVDVTGNRVKAVTVLLDDDIKINDFVLLHAGFAIAKVSQKEFDRQRRLFQELDDYARKTLES